MTSAQVIAERVELFVLTYNRADALRATLEQLLDSPFAGCRLTVLDNASTDDTPAVCDQFAERFEAMRVIRHRRNLGFGGNYMRAVELGEREYSWILADDDTYDFSAIGPVLSAIEEGAVDVIAMGAPEQQEWELGLRTTAGELVRRGSRFFFVFSFLPNTLFRGSLFTSDLIVAGYGNIPNLYPNFPFLARLVERDAPLYVAPRPVVTRTDDDLGRPSMLWWIHGYILSCDAIADAALRKRVVYELGSDGRSWTYLLLMHALLERVYSPRTVLRSVIEIAVRLQGAQRLAIPPMLVAAVLPVAPLRRLRDVLRRVRRQPPPVLPTDPLRSDAPVGRGDLKIGAGSR